MKLPAISIFSLSPTSSLEAHKISSSVGAKSIFLDYWTHSLSDMFQMGYIFLLDTSIYKSCSLCYNFFFAYPKWLDKVLAKG